MKRKQSAVGPALIILAGVFWGSMGLFVRRLESYGFTSVQIVALRLTLAVVMFGAILRMRGKGEFRIALRDLPLFLALGLVSVLFFTVCYFTAISMMTLSTAAILLYTSPIWIMIMSVLFFREKLTVRKLLALVLAFGGCVLVSGLSGDGITAKGLLIGLGAGIGYGLYSILGTVNDATWQGEGGAGYIIHSGTNGAGSVGTNGGKIVFSERSGRQSRLREGQRTR